MTRYHLKTINFRLLVLASLKNCNQAKTKPKRRISQKSLVEIYITALRAGPHKLVLRDAGLRLVW